MSGLTPELRSLRARIGGYARAARYDGRAVTEKARQTFDQRFYDEVDPDGTLPEQERERRAAAARKRYFTELAYKSARSRASKQAARITEAAHDVA